MFDGENPKGNFVFNTLILKVFFLKKSKKIK